ncbi:hypothetical protein HMPREF1146_1015 [Prevotella sp. MSX73]|nr:hypothetical protein HMPREF1146_1015 [Prevotella sp. MSX73]
MGNIWKKHHRKAAVKHLYINYSRKNKVLNLSTTFTTNLHSDK